MGLDSKKHNKLVIFMPYIYEIGFDVAVYKDFASYGYYIAKECGWSCAIVYYADRNIVAPEFEKYCCLVRLGPACEAVNMMDGIERYLKQNAKDINCCMVINYGSVPYKIAGLCKKYNKNIKVWSKLDMSQDGFSHFSDGSILRSLLSAPERFKSRNIDLFTVENRSFYNALKNTFVFKNRIAYLPNCPSMLDVDVKRLEIISKDNIMLYIGRMGAKVKNTELFIESLTLVSKQTLNGWKVMLVGEATKDFLHFLDETFLKYPHLKNIIIMQGAINDRQKLYELMSSSKVFCLTSRSESFGISVVEAGAMGCYPILTNFGSVVNDLTDNGRVGTVVENCNATVLAKAIEKVLECKNLGELCSSTREYINENFDYVKWVKDFEKHIR